MSALDTQINGTHYKDYAIQPVTFCMENKLDYCQSNIVKYVVRFRDKGGKADLLKAKHYIDLLWEHEYGGIVEEKQEEKPVLRDSLGTIFSSQKIHGGIGSGY